jgi:hypothetical protein
MIRFTMIGFANTFRRADSAGVTAFERGMQVVEYSGYRT